MISDCGLSRRALLAAGVFAAGCGQRDRVRDGRLHLRFSAWGEPVELVAFQRIIDRYHRVQKQVAIDLEEISYSARTDIDTLIAAGVGPDLFRVQYLDVGRYSPSGALIDLTKYLPAGLGDEFTAPVWTAVQYKGRPHALPHHTDTSAILYNKAIFKRLGIEAPQKLEEGWTWEEFIDVAHALQKKACEYAFVVNWTMGGAFRWLNFLYQRGGSLLNADFTKPAIPSQSALDALTWTQSFFRKGLVPASDSAKSSEQVENLFASGIVGMYFDVGPQSIREYKVGFEWGATFLPQDRHRASELGGNAVGISRDAKHPELAADFALFLTNEENMRDFVLAAEFLPVRKQLLKENLAYGYCPEEMRIHLEQSKTVPLDLAKTCTLPEFHRIERSLADGLDLTFTGGQSPEQTLNNIANEVNRMNLTA